MRIAIAGWHYGHRTLAENITYFASVGYDVFSANGKVFAGIFQNPGEPDEVAAALKQAGCGFTVHYGLPDPAKPDEVEAYYKSLDDIYDWQKKHGFIEILSFDVWYEGVYPMIEYTVKKFADTGVKLAFEDMCLTEISPALAALREKYPFYELLDAGHMNMRLFSADGDNSPEAFERALGRVKLPIIESHIHNNDGIKDLHCPLLDPTRIACERGSFPTRGYIRTLHRLGLDDIIITVEIIPYLYGSDGVHGDAVAIQDLRFVKKCIELELSSDFENIDFASIGAKR